MAKAGFVTTLIALSIALTAAYDKDCARGAQYWCQSFATAKDCGAVRHCTDTVWKNDEDPSKLLSTTSCEWCRKILDNAFTSIQHLANNNEMIKSKVSSGCRLFPLASLSTKCNNAVEQYGEAIAALMKAHRYGTLCHLMEICVAEPTPSTEEAPETEKPVIVGSHRCTWGPAYWCSSLSNARECGSTDHCSTEIWSQQSLEKKPSDNVCQYCEYTINKLRDILAGNQTEIAVEKWLAGACSMLPSKKLIDECVSTMSKYAEEVLVLIRANVEPGIICQLAQMCKEATIKVRATTTPVEKEPADIPIDEESKMLCHVIVQATHELAVVQQKNRNDVQVFLNGDCQNLAKPELVQKCDSLVHRYGHDIYGHVTSNVELSKICDHLDDFTDHTAAAGLPPVHCELCRFVLSTVKYMLDAKQPDDKVLAYIDEQVCSRLPAGLKTTCRTIVSNNGKALLDDIRLGSNPMLLCTRFQVCLEQVFERSSPISKKDLHTFVKTNICNQLGTFQEACSAMFDQDATRLLKTLVQDLEGDTLCAISGICPQKLSFFDNLAINDDKNKCQRCIDDFTRRKHIAEKLVNHSAEFLHHLCDQLPEKDQCTKAVDDSINELVTFVRSLDPQDICVQLKMCDQTMLATIKPTELTTSNDLISQEVIAYIKTEVCTKLGALEALCKKTIEMEGPAILADIAKQIDPKLACKTIGVCASESAFSNCNDKCDCCMGQVEVHEVRIATFLRSMAGNIRAVCNHMPNSAKCVQMTNQFDENINRITSKFNAKRACELLNHCSATPVEIETLPQCQKRIESKRQFLLNAITTINQNLKSLCEYIPWNKDCYTIIDRSTLDVEDVLKNLNNETACASGQSLAEQVCRSNSPFENLCTQLVVFDGDHTRLEALFKSMFNQNGNVEKSLCELDADSSASSNCVPSVDLKNCQDKCDCCVQFYTTKKNYDLSMIETMRSGLLATCDWSLTKDYCVSWFNRVCDRMKAKEEQFVPTTFCKRVELCPIEATTATTNVIVDKCQTCTSRLTANQQRFRSMVDDITATLLSFCTDADCRSLVQSAQQKTIDQISKIDSQKLCQRYGYCAPEHSSETIGYHSRLLGNPYHHIGSSIEALDLRLETALSSDLCFQYGQLRPMCEHLLASGQGRRYAGVYKALMKGDTKFVDDDLRDQLQTRPGTAVCDACKNAVQSGKDFWINSLDVVHNVMLQACERCPKKDECKAFYDQRFERLKTYINSIDANLFCQSVHLCNSQSLIIADELDQCTTCINFFDQRKENLEQGVTRLVTYLKDVCQRYNLKQCDVVLEGLENSVLPMIKNLQSKEICNQIGFCSLSGDNAAMSFDNYRKAIEGELEEKICNSLGPFASLCKQMQTGKINDNIRDLLHIGEDKTSMNLLSAANQAECARDGCQCCINRIEDKKKCLTNLANQVFDVLIKSCDYCPSKGSCRQYWTNEQGQCVSSIKSIDSKQICTKLGFCNVSSLCAKMNLFQDECERLLAQFAQSSPVIEQHLPHTSVVIVPTDEKKTEIDQVRDSNATCILCEYFMHIVTSYIGQNSTEEEIEQTLNKICQQMPKALASQCEEFVENYAPVIVATLMQDLDATTVCRRLNLCTKQMKVNLSHLTKADPAACGVCDYMTTYVRFTLNRDPSGKSIPAALAYVCAHLSDQQKPQCQTLVQLFGSRMKELKLDLGDNFCQHLAICEAPKREGLVRVPLKKDEDDYKTKIVKNLDETPECTICHYVISYLDAALKNNKSEEAIEAALEKVCKILPTKERAQCNDFIKSYGPVLAELIAEMADPDSICRYLGLCQVSTPAKVVTTKKPLVIGGGTHDYQHLPVQDAPFTCTICQYMITRMKHFVTLNQTEEEILASLKESCDLFSVLNLQQQCRTFLNDYGQFIIQMIASDVDPKVACQSMGICAKNQAAPSPSLSSSPKTDYTKCIFGMSYWCTSRQNAELCNAVEICETQVWSKKNKNIVI